MLAEFENLSKFMDLRNQNRDKIIKSLKNHKKWNDQFSFVKIDKKIDPSWFGLPILVNNKFKKVKNLFLENLSKKGIENRPIISGNFLNQPASKFYNFNLKKDDFKNSNEVENRGFFIGLHTKQISKNQIQKITENLLEIDNYL